MSAIPIGSTVRIEGFPPGGSSIDYNGLIGKVSSREVVGSGLGGKTAYSYVVDFPSVEIVVPVVDPVNRTVQHNVSSMPAQNIFDEAYVVRLS